MRREIGKRSSIIAEWKLDRVLISVCLLLIYYIAISASLRFERTLEEIGQAAISSAKAEVRAFAPPQLCFVDFAAALDLAQLQHSTLLLLSHLMSSAAVYIASGRRTAFGAFGGKLKSYTAAQVSCRAYCKLNTGLESFFTRAPIAEAAKHAPTDLNTRFLSWEALQARQLLQIYQKE